MLAVMSLHSAADVELADGVARQVSRQAFKYLGGVVDPCGTCDRELARIAKAMGKFRSMKRVWW